MNELDPLDQTLMRLFAQVGSRPEPPAETREAVYLSTLLAWRTMRRQRQLRVASFALAACAALAILGLGWYRLSALGGSAEVVATLVDSLGNARGDTRGRAVRRGEWLQSSAQRGLTLDLTTGDRLRMAAQSRLKFLENDRLHLESGAVYFASGVRDDARRTPPQSALYIETDIGQVIHLGTRYMVQRTADRMNVRVRSGAVRVRTALTDAALQHGSEAAYAADGRELFRRPLHSAAPAWGWVDALAPPLAIDGRRLTEVLNEIALETGREIAFADETVRLDCGMIELKGPLLELAVGDRLFAVLVTTDLEAIENGDSILIRRRTVQ